MYASTKLHKASITLPPYLCFPLISTIHNSLQMYITTASETTVSITWTLNMKYTHHSRKKIKPNVPIRDVFPNNCNYNWKPLTKSVTWQDFTSTYCHAIWSPGRSERATNHATLYPLGFCWSCSSHQKSTNGNMTVTFHTIYNSSMESSSCLWCRPW